MKKELLVTLLKEPFYDVMGFDNESKGTTFNKISNEELLKFFVYLSNNSVTIPRHLADYDKNYASFKQFIGYIVVLNKESKEIFAYKRLDGSGAKDLVGQVSFGVGGHSQPVISEDEEGNPVNGSGVDIFMDNFKREFNEELSYDLDADSGALLSVLGMVNDDTPNSIGVVHTGLVVALDVANIKDVKVKETEVLEGFVTNIKELRAQEKLESWTKMSLDVVEEYLNN